jgi:CRISPR-associated protein Csm4
MQQTFDCIKLHFSTPLHISRGREDYGKSEKLLRSDTVASALFMAALHVGASEQDALGMLDNVRLSSAFPFWQDEFFFPKPQARLPFNISGISEDRQGKPFKKLRFLGKSWFEKAIHAENSTIDNQKHLAQKIFLTERKIGTVFKAEVAQRVTIAPDYIEDAKPFYTERTHFGEGAGLFLLAQWSDPVPRRLFQQSFSLLGDLGIGTDRSVGNGFFKPEFSTLSLRVPDNAPAQCSLGLYLPAENELSDNDLEQSAWSIIRRGGYMAGAASHEHITLRKRSVFMFEEGSVFPNKPLTGKREDLKPAWQGLEHAVWREGRPVFVPIIKE